MMRDWSPLAAYSLSLAFLLAKALGQV